MRSLHIFVSFAILLGFCESANILVIYPHFGKSHFLAFEFMFQTLAAKGHNVTVISFFPQKNPLPNYRDIPIVTEEKITGLGVLTMGMFPHPRIVMYTGAHFVYTLAEFSCPIFLSHPNLQRFMRENNKFDVVMVELFNTNCHLGIAKKFDAPIIGKLKYISLISSETCCAIPGANESIRQVIISRI